MNDGKWICRRCKNGSQKKVQQQNKHDYITQSTHQTLYLYLMVTQNILRTYDGKWVFSETALDVIKRLTQIK